MTAAPPDSHPLATLHPAYFALVMATGVVSMGCRLAGWPVIAETLFALNLVFYPALWIVTLARAARHWSLLVADLSHHGRSVGFFTTIAATCVLGTQCLLIGDSVRAAVVLWALGIVLWAGLVYTILTLITIKPEKPALAEGIHGGWLLSVVAAQSVAVLGSQLAPRLGEHAPPALMFCAAMWLGGGMLYFWIISLIFYRYTFFVMSPADLTPPYWINMGAAAISTLAGALLVMAAPCSPVLQQLLPFLRGFTLMWWATATWWLPMLVILAVWRHVYRRFPLRYDPLYWGAVFPMGMYSVSTFRLSQIFELPYLATLARGFVCVALTAWSLAAFGMVRSWSSRHNRLELRPS